MMSSSSTKPKNVDSVDETSYDPSEPDSDEELEADFEIDARTSDSWEGNDSSEYDAEMEHTSAQMDDYNENMETFLETDSGDEQDNATEGSAANSSISTVQKKVVVNEKKKKKAKEKKETTPKLNIPGSARRYAYMLMTNI